MCERGATVSLLSFSLCITFRVSLLLLIVCEGYKDRRNDIELLHIG